MEQVLCIQAINDIAKAKWGIDIYQSARRWWA
jgi:hypothetical protein